MDRVDTSHWVAVISKFDVRLAARLRQVRGVDVLPIADEIWLRGPFPRGSAGEDLAEEELQQSLLRMLPGVRPYLVDGQGQLTALGNRVPSQRLPDGNWQPLAEWLHLELPVSNTCWPANVSPISMSLVRCTEEFASTLLLTSFSWWAEWAETAPQWRLERLVFAVDSASGMSGMALVTGGTTVDAVLPGASALPLTVPRVLIRGTPLPPLPGGTAVGAALPGASALPLTGSRVLIRGTPLPPLPGERWVERNGIATPAGWCWDPPVDASVLCSSLEIERGDVVLLESSQWQIVAAADWVRATRSAVRATVEACQ
jgi:hypothetical protein